MNRNILRIVAHGDWDGVIGAGLLSRVYDVPLEFPLELADLIIEDAACIEITPGRVSSIRNSIIIDHHATEAHPYVDEKGNVWILKPEYRAVSTLIADHWQLEFPSEWRTAVEEVDTANLNSPLSKTLWRAYRVDAKGFPRQKVAEMVRKGEWEQLGKWAYEKQEEYRNVEEKTKELLSRSTKLTSESVYFTFSFNDRWERGASKEAMLLLEEKNPIVVAIAVEEKGVKGGTIASRRNVDLTKAYEHLRKKGYTSGGHRNVGGFQALEPKTLEQALRDLKSALENLKEET
ncbi:MAG: hypothetical protein KIH08_01350 [Candidatus Freyarchaeota archaeon]|nr:hypothetical protein [Candidatus Jordarchaeia archaeon]MBS7267231.1 hypothetical protein [Candidatus Jordarchaeia archaeon]MBS7278444.1 hypothetical protein [Candidatus Jordarchaeia archaeon]